ncbi:MAG: YbgA family protein [Pseudomonadota bacterium]
MNFPRLKIAVSDCLRGTQCRYNGGHAQDDFVNDHLARYADFYPFCPEAAVIGTPRETIRLVGIDTQVRVIGPKSKSDYTEGLQAYNDKIIPKILSHQMDGAVVKSRSPSCGLERIKVYQPSGEWHGSKDPMQAGLFTGDLQKAAPYLAIEEEGRLTDAWLRESFMLQAFTSARWREFCEAEPTVGKFQAFHRDHKYLFQSKSEGIYRELGALVSATRKHNLAESLLGYEQKMFALLACRSTKGHVKNVLDHIYGYFKHELTPLEKNHYHETVTEFMDNIVPLIAVIKVLEQFLNHYGSDYLSSQVFFNPYPADLALRSTTSAYR